MDPIPTQPATAPPPLFFAEGIGQALPLARQEERGQMALDLELQERLEALPSTQRGKYTGKAFKAKDPHRYGLIVRGLALGTSKQALSKALGVSWELVRAIEIEERGTSIREEKKTFADALAGVIEQGIDGLMDKAAAGKLSALDVAVLLDKHQLLRGEATAITETKGEDPAVAAYRAFLEGAAQRMGMKAADEFAKGATEAARVVDIAAETVANGVHPLVSAAQTVDNQQPDSDV